MKYRILIVIFIILVSSLTYAQQSDNLCTTKFSLAEQDTLGNVNVGFSQDGLKWYEKKVEKQYPSVCYAEQKTNEGVWFFIQVTTQSQGTATATTQNADGSTSHTTVTTGTVDYPVYTLKIGRFNNGVLEVLRTFQRIKSPANGTLTGFAHSFSNPEHDVIEDAVSWLSAFEASNASTKQ
jgi:hypothetical protein